MALVRNCSKLFSVAFFALALSACGPQERSEPSCNFVQNTQGQRVSWKEEAPVVLYIHKSVPTEFHDAILRAAQRWEASLGRPLFHFKGILEGDGPARDGVSAIYWMNQWDVAERSKEQARTTIYWTGNQIRESDLRINDRDFDFSATTQPKTGMVDLESLVVHELGHVIGLQHNGAGGSVMAESLASSVLRWNPQQVDVESAKCEY